MRCLEDGRKINMLLYSPPIFSMSDEQCPSDCTVFVRGGVAAPHNLCAWFGKSQQRSLKFRQPSRLVEFDKLLHISWVTVILWMCFKHVANLSYCTIASTSFIAGWDTRSIQIKTCLLYFLCWESHYTRTMGILHQAYTYDMAVKLLWNMPSTVQDWIVGQVSSSIFF